MFTEHNNVTSPCPFDSRGSLLRPYGFSSLLRAFLQRKKHGVSTISECREALPCITQKIINQPLRVKELKTTLNQAFKSLQSGGFGFYKLTGEV